MKNSERGFTLIELLVVTAILSLMVGAVSMSILQVVYGTDRSNNRMTAIREVQNAGSWISRDVVTAQDVVVDNDSETDEFLILTWREGVYLEVLTEHEVKYSFQDLSGGVGKLKRTHSIDGVVNRETLVAEYIYYNSDDPDNTTKAVYQEPVLTVQISSSIGEANEIKEYRVWHRSTY